MPPRAGTSTAVDVLMPCRRWSPSRFVLVPPRRSPPPASRSAAGVPARARRRGRVVACSPAGALVGAGWCSNDRALARFLGPRPIRAIVALGRDAQRASGRPAACPTRPTSRARARSPSSCGPTRLTLRRLLGADVVAMVAALALLLVMAVDWYRSTVGRARARDREALRAHRRHGGRRRQRENEDAARARQAQAEEKNAWQATGRSTGSILIGLLGAIVLAVRARGCAPRGGGSNLPRRRPPPPRCWPRSRALVAYRSSRSRASTRPPPSRPARHWR